MRTNRLIGMVGCVMALAGPAAGQVMFGSTSSGEFGTVDQTTGNFTFIGNPATGIGGVLSGISFDTAGRLFGSVPSDDGNCCTTLIEIDPANGSRLQSIGPIRDGANDLRITDLATQPSTNALFGIDKTGSLYTIDKVTAAATLIGDTDLARGGLAFAPNGTLFLANVDGQVTRLDPATGLPVGTLFDEGDCFDGLGVRPTDGTLFATECDGNNVFAIDPASGNLTPLDPSDDFDTADLAFQLIPAAAPAPALAPVPMVILAGALAAAGAIRMARRRRPPSQ